MSIVILSAYLLTFIQAARCRCDFIAVLAIVFLFIGCFALFSQQFSRSACICMGIIFSVALGLMAINGLYLHDLYLQRIAEYWYGAIQALIMIPVVLVKFLLPDDEQAETDIS